MTDGTQGPGNLSPGGEPADQGPGHQRVRTRGGGQSVQGAETPSALSPAGGRVGYCPERLGTGGPGPAEGGMRGRPEDQEGGKATNSEIQWLARPQPGSPHSFL